MSNMTAVSQEEQITCFLLEDTNLIIDLQFW